MMKYTASLLLGLLLAFVQACAIDRHAEHAATDGPANATITLSRIAFGSCSNPRNPVPIFDTVARAEPDLMIFLGDNVYADTTDETELRAAYRVLADNPGFQHIQQTCPVLATWDDHDYGINDAGREHPAKAMSQRVFLEFWNVPKDSPRWHREGVYDTRVFGPPGKRVQIILLDTRYHRSPLAPRPQEERSRTGGGPYTPNPDPASTMLGEEQWRWLQDQLKQPAELRLIASSVQAVAEEHNWETWAMMPSERTRLFDLIRDAGANGVVFVSGDRHRAEVSRLADADPYPIYDVTASSFNRPSKPNNEPNRHRIGKQYEPANFGMISIDWNKPDPIVALSVRDVDGRAVIEHHFPLSEITPPR